MRPKDFRIVNRLSVINFYAWISEEYKNKVYIGEQLLTVNQIKQLIIWLQQVVKYLENQK